MSPSSKRALTSEKLFPFGVGFVISTAMLVTGAQTLMTLVVIGLCLDRIATPPSQPAGVSAASIEPGAAPATLQGASLDADWFAEDASPR